MEELIKAAQALLTYIERDNVYDTMDDDGGGHIDCSQSYAFKDLTHDLEYAIEDSAPTINAVNVIKEGFITMVQTAIARQSQ
jgi:hypothetical protein